MKVKLTKKFVDSIDYTAKGYEIKINVGDINQLE